LIENLVVAGNAWSVRSSL